MKKISDRVTPNKSGHLQIKNKLKKLEKIDAAYFKGKKYFEEDGTQNYLVFQPMLRYFKRIAGVGSGNYIYFWKSKGLSDERLDSNTASKHERVEFNRSCLKQDKVTYDHGTIVYIYTLFMR